MKKEVILATVLSVVFTWSSLAGAKSFDMGIKLGYSIPAGGFADASDEGPALGIFSSYWITPRTALQFSFLGHGHDLSVAEPSDFLASIGEQALDDFSTMSNADITMREFVFNGKYVFTDGKILPYLIAGGGMYVWEVTVDGNEPGGRISERTGTGPDGPDSSTTTTYEIGSEISRSGSFVDLGLNAGLGIAFMLTGEISLGIEAMYSYVFGNFDEGFLNVTSVLTYGF